MAWGRRARPADAELIDDPAAVREAALQLLERMRRTRSDLTQRLVDKGFAPAAIGPVLDRLTEVGLIDDTEYARAYLAGRWGRRPTGLRRLQQELRAKGIGDEAFDSARTALEQQGATGDEHAAAARLVAQAARRYAALEPRVREQRLYALLTRRGFDREVIRAVLAQRLAEAGE